MLEEMPMDEPECETSKLNRILMMVLSAGIIVLLAFLVYRALLNEGFGPS